MVMCSLSVMCLQTRQDTMGGNSPSGTGAHGPADPQISQASKRCFEAAGAALGRLGVPATIRRAVADFTERYVQKDRCPADDQLEGAR